MLLTLQRNHDVTSCSHNAFMFAWVFAGIPILIAFAGNLIITIILLWDVTALSRQMQKLANSWRQGSLDETQNDAGLLRRLSRRMSSFRLSEPGLPLTNPDRSTEVASMVEGSTTSFTLPARSNRSSTRRNGDMKQHLKIQALLYVVAFITVYLFGFINQIAVEINGSAPFIITLIERITNPLQGFCNIIIYTRIRVSSLRSTSNLSWFKAFWTVVKSGANNKSTPGRGREVQTPSSLRNPSLRRPTFRRISPSRIPSLKDPSRPLEQASCGSEQLSEPECSIQHMNINEMSSLQSNSAAEHLSLTRQNEVTFQNSIDQKQYMFNNKDDNVDDDESAFGNEKQFIS